MRNEGTARNGRRGEPRRRTPRRRPSPPRASRNLRGADEGTRAACERAARHPDRLPAEALGRAAPRMWARRRPRQVFGLVDGACGIPSMGDGTRERLAYCPSLPGPAVRALPVLVTGVVSTYRCGAAPAWDRVRSAPASLLIHLYILIQRCNLSGCKVRRPSAGVKRRAPTPPDVARPRPWPRPHPLAGPASGRRPDAGPREGPQNVLLTLR